MIRAADFYILRDGEEAVRPLTADEIETFDNLTARRNAQERTLRVALNYFANKTEEQAEEEKRLWDSVTGLPRGEADHHYAAKLINGTMMLVRCPDTDTTRL